MTQPWGTQIDGRPTRRELLELYAERQAAGIDESKRMLRELFPDPAVMRSPNPERAAAAEQGEIAVASAAWWGWDSQNATQILQKAMDSPVDILVVPAMPGDWLSAEVEIDGPAMILFEPGAAIKALPGAFMGKKEYLLTAYRQQGLTIRGYGARLEMRKKEYTQEPYVWSQWRHALAILESEDISVEGLRILRSGGDGIYVGQHRDGVPSRNILLRDLTLLENHRQGVSVIAADGFRMEYAYIADTRGVPPSSAIDFEPNNGVYGLTGCEVYASLFEGNAGAALTVYLRNLSDADPPVNILIEKTLVLGSPLSTFIAGVGKGVRGRLEIRDSAIRGVGIALESPSFSIDKAIE